MGEAKDLLEEKNSQIHMLSTRYYSCLVVSLQPLRVMSTIQATLPMVTAMDIITTPTTNNLWYPQRLCNQPILSNKLPAPAVKPEDQWMSHLTMITELSTLRLRSRKLFTTQFLLTTESLLPMTLPHPMLLLLLLTGRRL